MKNTRSLLPAAFAALFALALPAAARVLSQEEIETAAANFLAFDSLARELLPGRTVAGVRPRESVWIADLEPSGYVVIAGSDCAEPIAAFGPNTMVEPDPEDPFYTVLGLASAYAERAEAEGPFPAPAAAGEGEGEDAPSPEQAQADAARRASRWDLFLHGPAPTAGEELPAADPSNIIVQPFLTMHWNQWQPYNDYCPRVAKATESGWDVYRNRSPVGCVPTALAQIMGYYKWPARFDRVFGYTNSCSSGPFTRVAYRFDGSVPFEWDDLTDTYTYSSWGDMSSSVKESVRYPIARLMNFNDVMTRVSFGGVGSGGGSGANVYTGASNNPWYTGLSGVSKANWPNTIKTATQAGEPVPVGVPGHQIVAHGYAEDSAGAKYCYVNYGWGGQNDGWFDLASTSGDYLTDVDLGFVPYNSAQVDPLPAYSGPSVTLNWHSPDHWRGVTTGFTVTASYAGDTVSDLSDDFTSPKGALSGPATVGVVSATGRSGPVLGFDGASEEEMEQACTWDPVILTSSSVLTFDFWYYKGFRGSTFKVQAAFDGGTWTDLFTSGVWTTSPSWSSKTVNLSSHAGKSARFRAYLYTPDPTSGNNVIYQHGTAGVQVVVDNFKVTNCRSAGGTVTATVAGTARSHTFTGLVAGKTYSFTVTPIAPNANGSGGATTTIASAASSIPSISQVWADTSSTNQVKEGFFRNCALSGRTVLHVQCSANTAALEAHSGNWTALPDSAIAVHDVGGGLFDVVFDTALPTSADDQRLMMTLVAKDEYGCSGAKNLSLRLLASVPSETYTPSTKTPPTTDGGSVSAVLATTATAAVEVTSFGREGTSATVTMSVYRGTSATGTAVSTQNKSLASLGTASFSLTGLTSGATYTVRFVTKSSNNMSTTDDVTFTTVLNKAPTIASVSAGTPSSSSAPVTVNLSAIGDGSTSVTLKVEVSTQSNFSSIAKTVTQNNVTATGATTLTVSGLASATKYYVRVTATGSNGMSSTNTSASFTTADPSVPSGSFTLGTPTLNTIPVNWSVSSIGTGNSSATVYVDYGTTTSFGTTKTAGTATGSKTGTYSITGLNPETKYYVRVRIVAGSKTFTCDTLAATTLPVGDPAVTGSFKSSTQYTAVVNYALTALGTGASSATIYLDYGTSSSYGSTATIASNVTGSKSGAYTLSGLNPETTYHFRVRAVNNANKTGKTSDFTGATTAVGTPAATVAATETMSRGATLAVSVTSLGAAATSATITLEYGTTTSYGSTATVSPATLTAAGTATASLSGLQSNTKYYVRATVKNNGNKSVQPTTTFTTLQPNDPVLGEPSATTSYTSASVSVPVTMLGSSAAWANGTVRYGTTTACSMGSVAIARFTQPGTVSASITGLAQDTTYYYEITIVNSATGQTTVTGSFKTKAVATLAWGEGYYEGGLLQGYNKGGNQQWDLAVDKAAAEAARWNSSGYAASFAYGAVASYQTKSTSNWTNPYDGATYPMDNYNRMWAYGGQMWMEKGVKYYFAVNFFYAASITVDGTVVCSEDNGGNGTPQVGSVTPTTTGWHDIAVAVGSNGNGAGACGNPWNSGSPFTSLRYGTAWNTNGLSSVTSSNASQWKKLLDAGDRHLFRARGKQGECAFLDQTPTWTKTSLKVPVRIDSLVDGMTLTVYIGRRADAWYFEDRWERSATVAAVPDGASVQSVTFNGIDTTTDWYVSARISDGSKYDQWTDPVKWTPVVPDFEKPTFSVKATDGVEPMAFGGTSSAPKVTITINNPSDSAVYAVYASGTVDGTFTRVTSKQTRKGDLLSFEVDAGTGGARFFQIKAAATESDLP